MLPEQLVENSLAVLGGDPQAVYEKLLQGGYFGKQNNSKYCPLARYTQAILDMIYGHKYIAELCASSVLLDCDLFVTSIPISVPVFNFLVNFDRGKYQALISDTNHRSEY